MTGTVSRLHVRAPPGQAATTRARTEDALALATPDARLLVVRRLDLGRLGLRSPAAAWHARAAQLVGELDRRAVHATTPRAAFADAVWFRSGEEAQALLLWELAAGRLPSAWFWPLAVHGWDRAPLKTWLPRLLAEAAADARRETTLAHAIAAVAAAGRLPAVTAALAGALLIADVRKSATNTTPAPPPQQTPAADPARARAGRILDRLDPRARAAFLAALAAPTTGATERQWLARLALLAGAPELALHPPLLAAVVGALAAPREPGPAPASFTAEARRLLPTHEPEFRPSAQRRAEVRSRRTAAPPLLRPDTRSAAVPWAPACPWAPPAAEAPGAPWTQSAAKAPGNEDLPPDESESLGAGVFLLLGPLARMGFADWLAVRPERAADGFGRTLLHSIARRVRVPPDDPAVALLHAVPPAEWSDPLGLWRVGLNRWLRRVAGVRLTEVVRRRGWIASEPESISVSFRLGDADIRLRRLALDVDPGWVPWLACSVRYHYRERPAAEERR